MKTSFSVVVLIASGIAITQTARANPPARGGSLGATPHFSSAAHFARPVSPGVARGLTGPRPVINLQRPQPAVRYVRPSITTGSNLPPRSWATNSPRSRIAPTNTALSRSATPAPATRNAQNSNNRLSFAEASRRYTHQWHDRNWWRNRYSNIVLVGGGYYYWDLGYWCPAWGYDPTNESYPYDGPIYGFDGLNPDQVVADVQAQLQQDGYYNGPINGILDGPTQTAIAYYQRDHNLAITWVVDAATVASLGLS
jgi:Putative peptidoglycan binding domain